MEREKSQLKSGSLFKLQIKTVGVPTISCQPKHSTRIA